MTPAPENAQRAVRIGLTDTYARLCPNGIEQVRAVNGKLGFKSGDRSVRNSFGVEEHEFYKSPYVFLRFTNPDTGGMCRKELGRFLLGVDRPVSHRNGDPLDFTIENLEASPVREKKPVNKSDRAAGISATASDGLTPQQQIDKLAEIFPYLLKKAGAILRDPHPDLSDVFGLTEARGPEVVGALMPGLIERIKAGKVRNVVGTALRAVEIQALKELGRKNLKASPIKSDAGQRAFIRKLKSEMPGEKAFFLATDDGQLCTFFDRSAKKPNSFDYDAIPA